MDDIIINKASTIERCLKRIKEEYQGSETEFASNYTKQDAIILNLQRACEAAIDMATHIVKIRTLGVPQTSKEVFSLLEKATIIPKSISKKLQAMVGFRNVAVHDYMALNMEIVQSVIEDELGVFLQFNKYLLKLN
ncbi:type II toxin-antitoxin system toxin [soil metagenome]